MTTDSETTETQTAGPRWQPVCAIDRRVLGVLVEKAKTTPDAYPLSLNGLVTGANQKNNRHPLTQYEAQDIEESLDRLRRLGAVAAVQGGGRVEKYRHYMYDWLGVDKVELGVMAELLLRGAQTEGELRGRAARMDPIPDLAALRTVMDSLKAKRLVQALTPEGRGQIVTHCLYLPEELTRLRQQHGDAPAARPHSVSPASHAEVAPRQSASATYEAAPRPVAAVPSLSGSVASAGAGGAGSSAGGAGAGAGAAEIAGLRRELEALRGTVTQLRSDLADLAAESQRNADELDRLRQSLGG